MRVILNYGLGVDSTVILHRWLTDPSSRDFELGELTVVTAMTGDEFNDTRRKVEAHALPLMRGKGVRYVQLARNGHNVADGITVLSDTTEPVRLFADGVRKLSDELLTAGTVPQVASRKCSIKFKGWVIDSWLAAEMAGRAFRQAMGFNADEQRRITRDGCYGGDNRNAEYPLMSWGMGREACEKYLLEQFGEPWPKSCCRFCPFSRGQEGVLERYRRSPGEAAQALLIEYVSLALNPRMTLYANKSLRSLVGAAEEDAFQALLLGMEWAVYRVRRVYKRKGQADRSVELVERGGRREMEQSLLALGGPVSHEGGVMRVYLRRREPDVYPTAEEMYVVAPAVVPTKSKKSFDQGWERISLEMVLPS